MKHRILMAWLCSVVLLVPAQLLKAEKEVTTENIAAGIKQHIDEKTKAGGGHFKLKDGEKELSLTLVKIHNDKLTSLGKGKHFACVDFKGTDGNTYDVDFFLKGEPGAMSVTDTGLHKTNGKPRYNWKQRRNGTWHKVKVRA